MNNMLHIGRISSLSLDLSLKGSQYNVGVKSVHITTTVT